MRMLATETLAIYLLIWCDHMFSFAKQLKSWQVFLFALHINNILVTAVAILSY